MTSARNESLEHHKIPVDLTIESIESQQRNKSLPKLKYFKAQAYINNMINMKTQKSFRIQNYDEQETLNEVTPTISVKRSQAHYKNNLKQILIDTLSHR